MRPIQNSYLKEIKEIYLGGNSLERTIMDEVALTNYETGTRKGRRTNTRVTKERSKQGITAIIAGMEN